MNLRYRFTLVVLFLCAGLLLGFVPFQRWLNDNSQQIESSQVFATSIPAEQEEPAEAELISGQPVRIVIPSVDIDLKVVGGYYNLDSKTWTLSKDKAHYATITPLPNNKSGNTFIYGHSRKEVFSNLGKLQIGAKAIIRTDNGHRFVYRLEYITETNPNDDSLFHYEGDPILTLQTCSGLWYQYRQLFTFSLVEAT